MPISKINYLGLAVAEETAAASQELSAQAAGLRQLVSKFRLNV